MIEKGHVVYTDVKVCLGSKESRGCFVTVKFDSQEQIDVLIDSLSKLRDDLFSAPNHFHLSDYVNKQPASPRPCATEIIFWNELYEKEFFFDEYVKEDLLKNFDSLIYQELL